MRSLEALFRRRAADRVAAPAPTLDARSTVADLVAALAATRASAAIVTGPAGDIVGIVTESDVVGRVALRAGPETPVAEVISAPVETVGAGDLLYHAIARMRSLGVRHMPVVAADGRVLGMLGLDSALAASMGDVVAMIDMLTREASIDGMTEVKRAQIAVVAALFDEGVPAQDIQAILSGINRDIAARVLEISIADMAGEPDWGPPPVAFACIVMGSGGRDESYLFPDQDNGFILDDYPDDAHGEVDPWFIELASRFTNALDRIGFPLCEGHVMAVNPLWRKTRPQWRHQMALWMRQRAGASARFADIFFDFAHAWGESAYVDELRDVVTPLVAGNADFLRDLYELQADHRVGLGLFGRLVTQGGMANLKHHGSLPLVEGVRLLALRAGIPATSTPGRMDGLVAAGVLDRDERDELGDAQRHIARLLLRRQLADFQAGRRVGNLVDPGSLSRHERRRLVDGYRAIDAFRRKVRGEFEHGVL